MLLTLTAAAWLSSPLGAAIPPPEDPALQALATVQPQAIVEQDSAAEPPEDEFLEGHSHLGSAFNEGPRQAAYLMDGLPQLDFPVTSPSELARKFVGQGVAQLHGFWYFEAERSFRQAASIDPTCAMAYWGMAMGSFDSDERAAPFAREAYLRREHITPREQAYVDAIARYFAADAEPTEAELAKARGESEGKVELTLGERGGSSERRERFEEDLEQIVSDYPDDIEAKAFLVNQRYLDNSYGDDLPRSDSEELLQQIFAANPSHPSHHYRIHLWDARDTWSRTLDSAAAIGHTAPGIAHQWHMGGHVYDRAGRHDDAAFQQEASARVDHAQMMRDHVMPDEIHNYAHNNEWLVRSLRSVGRVHEATDLARNMIELPRHPKYNSLRGGGSASFGRQRLFDTLTMFEMWDDLLELADTMYLEPSERAQDEAYRAYLLGWAHFAHGEVEALEEQAGIVEDLLEAAQAQAADEGERPRRRRGRRGRRSPTAELEERLTVLQALIDYRAGDREAALERLADADVDETELSLLYLEAGFEDDAKRIAREATRRANGVALPHANLAYVLWACGEVEEAARVFEEDVQPLSARVDLDVPAFARLSGLATVLGYEEDWRVGYETPADVGHRPDLATLGPFRWSPMPAESWSLPDGFGTELSLADYEGRPVLVVFFLGFGCVHCVEQLTVLGPAYEQFKDAGIEIVAIGTDTIEQLNTSESEGPRSAYGFPLLADPELTVFKQWRCYDDFEHMALHGTFLIDGAGLVRWQDVSYDPFMDMEFLLAESKRLLEMPVGQGGPGIAISSAKVH